jgi:hypothetical protein
LESGQGALCLSYNGGDVLIIGSTENIHSEIQASVFKLACYQDWQLLFRLIISFR